MKKENLEKALKVLNRNNACDLSNTEAQGHSAIVEALQLVHGEGFTEYMTRDEWEYMDAEERAEYMTDKPDYMEDFEFFCEYCDTYNARLIFSTVEKVEKMLEA